MEHFKLVEVDFHNLMENMKAWEGFIQMDSDNQRNMLIITKKNHRIIIILYS